MRKALLNVIGCFFSVCLFAQAGTPDSTFGSNGVAKIAVPLSGTQHSVDARRFVQLPGSSFIVVVSLAAPTDSNRVYFYKIKYNGTVDSSFGVNGRVWILPQEPYFFITAMTADAKGRILITFEENYYTTANFMIARFNRDGTRDSSFGKNGMAVLKNVPYILHPIGDALTVLPDGRILTAAFTYINNVNVSVLACLTSSGELDKSFNGKGYTTYIPVTTGTGGGYFYDNSMPLVVQPSGKIILTWVDIVRFNADGTRDMNFGENGYIAPKKQNTDIEVFYDTKVLPDGRFMACGSLETFDREGGGDMTDNIYRYTKDGKPDKTLANTGVITVSSGYYEDYPTTIGCLTVQPDNKFLISEIPDINNTYNATITRYRSDGVRDSSFADNGSIHVSPMSYETYMIAQILLEHDNKIVTLGYPSEDEQNITGYFYLSRYKNDVNVTNRSIGQPVSAASISSKAAAAAVKLYPNPASDMITITGLPASSRSDIRLIDANGRILSENFTSESSYTMNVKNLLPGVYYILVIQNNNQVIKQQFIKQ